MYSISTTVTWETHWKACDFMIWSSTQSLSWLTVVHDCFFLLTGDRMWTATTMSTCQSRTVHVCWMCATTTLTMWKRCSWNSTFVSTQQWPRLSVSSTFVTRSTRTAGSRTLAPKSTMGNSNGRLGDMNTSSRAVNTLRHANFATVLRMLSFQRVHSTSRTGWACRVRISHTFYTRWQRSSDCTSRGSWTVPQTHSWLSARGWVPPTRYCTHSSTVCL